MAPSEAADYGVDLVNAGNIGAAGVISHELDQASWPVAKNKVDTAIAQSQDAVEAYGKASEKTISTLADVPTWKQISGPQGSTPGGVYEDENGGKFYIKCPSTHKHGRNELLAQDLYKMAGVHVLESQGTVIDGKPCIASPWSEDLKGSGTNPKDIPGTKGGFVADAWLAELGRGWCWIFQV